MSVDLAGMTNDTDMMATSYGGIPHRRLLRDRKRLARRGIGAGVKIRLRAVRRRGWSAEDKLRIVRETLGSGAVANWHGTSTGLLFTSRKEIGQRGVGG